MNFQGDKVVVTLEEEEVVNKKIEEIEEERVEFNTHTHTKNKTKWLDWLAAFLWVYMTSTFIIGYLTETFYPLLWVILFVFPSVGLYCFAKWLWS